MKWKFYYLINPAVTHGLKCNIVLDRISIAPSKQNLVLAFLLHNFIIQLKHHIQFWKQLNERN